MCEALLEPTPAAEDMCQHCTFRVPNGCRSELTDEFGNGKGPKNTKHKIGERPVLFSRVENRVGGNVCEALLEPSPVAPPHAAPLGF